MSDALLQNSTPLIPANETERLAALHRYKILDTPPEAAFDRITALAARLFKMPIALISLVDESRAWFKSCIGFEAQEVPRDVTLCSFSVLTDEPLIIPDTRLDDRFACNPFVQQEPGVRFYAGAPLISHDGFNLGTLCLLDSQPHEPLTAEQQATLVDLAAMVVDELELRLAARKVAQVDAALMEITRGVSAAMGGAFFESLVLHFAKVLAVDYVYIGVVEGDEPKMIRTIALCAQGQAADNVEYLLQDTPCWEVIEQRKICCYPSNVQAHFPHAPLLKPLCVESYLAIPFFDLNGTPLGLLGVMDSKSLENVHLAESLLTIFASRITTELERQQFEQKRSRFFTVASDLQVIIRADGYFEWVSPSVERLLGWTSAEMTSRPWTEFVHPDDRNASIEEAASLFLGQKTLAFENRYRHKDGSYRWLQWRAQQEGEMLYGSTVDITAAKQLEIDRIEAETALRESEERFRLMADVVPQIVWITDAEGQVEFFNKQWSNYTGVLYEPTNAAEIAANFVHPDDAAHTLEEFNAARQAGSMFAVEHRIRSAAGEYRWFIVRAEPYFDPQTGKIVRWFGTSIDIHDRKQAEITIQSSNNRLKLLAETANDLLLTIDPKAFLASLLNKVAAHLQLEIYVNYLLQEDEQRLELRAYGGISEEVAQAARYLQLGQAVCGCVVQQRHPVVVDAGLDATDPMAIPVQAIGIRAYASYPLMIGDRVIGTLGLGTRQRDRFTQDELDLMQAVAAQVSAALERSRLITELQERAEALDRANHIKDEFLAVLSHELRTPLNPILGWTRLLQNGKLDATRQREALATIERNARLQTQLIEDLLDISRIMQGKLSLTAAPVSLSFVIEAAIETIRLAAEAKHIQLRLDFASAVAQVSGDAARLQQVVWNLLTNAVKFTPNNGQITVELRQIDRFAQIRVIDTGKGIKPQFLPHIFEYFRQEDSSTTRKFGGLGLGLAIVRQIVELHGGTVKADSLGEHQGAAFTVQLPAIEQHVSTRSPKYHHDSQNLENPLSNLQILVVDDDDDTRQLQAFALEQNGATVTAVASGLEALQVFDRAIPDLLVSDVGMPEMDGYTLIKQLRSRPTDRGGDILAIALTAYASDGDQQKAIEAGFQMHLTKPIEPEALVKQIVRLWGEKN